jgi:hypothetical protein
VKNRDLTHKKGAGFLVCQFGVSDLPKWLLHRFKDRVYLDKEYPRMHRAMDWPSKFLKRRHRRLFHDYKAVHIIAEDEYPDDPNAFWSGVLHISTDRECSADPEHRKFLERMEKLCRPKKRKKQRSRRKKKKAIYEDPIVKDLKKWAEFKRLAQILYSR